MGFCMQSCTDTECIYTVSVLTFKLNFTCHSSVDSTHHKHKQSEKPKPSSPGCTDQYLFLCRPVSSGGEEEPLASATASN